jgi:hypothetical protein
MDPRSHDGLYVDRLNSANRWTNQLPQMGLRLRETLPDVVAEIGSGSYFKSFAETYAPFVVRAGLVPSADVDAWVAAQLKSIEAGMFFRILQLLRVSGHT